MKPPTLQKFIKPAALLALLVFASVPAFANTVSEDQALDQKLGLFGGNWNHPPAPPTGGTGGGVAPTQIKMPLPPFQQQPTPPPPVVQPPPRIRPPT